MTGTPRGGFQTTFTKEKKSKVSSWDNRFISPQPGKKKLGEGKLGIMEGGHQGQNY